MPSKKFIHGRGAESNPENRYTGLRADYDPEHDDANEGPASPATTWMRDASKSIIAYNDSPDVGFDASVNPYRGCEHGCSYCYARPTHEYFGLSAGLDFESRILVKERAPELLREELSARSWKPKVLAFSGVTDCYQPLERTMRLTRRCLAVLAEHNNPAFVVTKNALVCRDVDLLVKLAEKNAAAVAISITTLDDGLAGSLEPRASRPAKRLEAVRTLSRAGVPVGVMVAPTIPGLTDSEVPAILSAARKHGASFAGYVMLRLPLTVAPIFLEWLDRCCPEHSGKVRSRLTSLRGGKMNDYEFGTRMRGQGVFADEISWVFHASCRKFGIATAFPELSTDSFLRKPGQLELF